jgi:hypothetical protein
VEIGVALDGASRAILVAEGKGFSADAVPFPVGQLPEGDGVVYCRVEEPAPLVEHGLVWFETSPLMETFLETAREIVRSSESPSTEEGLPGEELGQRAVS